MNDSRGTEFVKINIYSEKSEGVFFVRLSIFLLSIMLSYLQMKRLNKLIRFANKDGLFEWWNLHHLWALEISDRQIVVLSVSTITTRKLNVYM